MDKNITARIKAKVDKRGNCSLELNGTPAALLNLMLNVIQQLYRDLSPEAAELFADACIESLPGIFGREVEKNDEE